jgi:hypothetical protein
MQMQRVMLAEEDELGLGMMTGTPIVLLPDAPKLKSHHPPPKPLSSPKKHHPLAAAFMTKKISLPIH